MPTRPVRSMEKQDIGMRRVQDPDHIRDVYGRLPAIHVYGLADVTLFWDRSTWWVSDLDPTALVGVLDLPGSELPVLYAVSVRAPAATRNLLVALAEAGHLGPELIYTAPPGAADALAGTHQARWRRDYRKVVLARPDVLPPADPRVVALGRTDAPRVARLFATDPQAGEFFHPGLFDDGWYRAIAAADGELLAVAGTHVVDRATGVAAIGNVATHPAARRQGLARAVVATLARELDGHGLHVGLNVTVDNLGARRLYAGLGFDETIAYEEAELVAREG